MKDKSCCYLRIEGEFNLKDIINIMQIKPSSKGKNNKLSYADYFLLKNKEFDIVSIVNNLNDYLKKYEDKLKEIRRKYNIKYIITILKNSMDYGDKPSFVISNELMEFCLINNISFDIKINRRKSKNEIINKSFCHSYFRSLGHFDPNILSDELGLVPDSVVNEGEPIYKDGVLVENSAGYSSCYFGKCKNYGGVVNNELLNTIDNLYDKIQLLKEMKKKYKLQYFLQTVIYSYDDGDIIDLSPSEKVLEFAYKTDSNLEFDIYVHKN